MILSNLFDLLTAQAMYVLVITLWLMYKLYNKGFFNIPTEGYYIGTKQCI